MCLRFPTISEEVINTLNLNRILDLYIELPKASDKYHFKLKESDYFNDFKNIIVDFKSNSGSEISSETARLNELLEIDGVKDLFDEKKWAVSFKINKYILPPVMFNNIYKGALGEQVGKFILKTHFKIELEELPTEQYEIFDYKIKDSNIYVDFKHWKETTEIGFENQESKIRKKLEKMQGDKVFIINILSTNDWKTVKSTDGKIIEVPYLWNSQTKELNHSILKEINTYAAL